MVPYKHWVEEGRRTQTETSVYLFTLSQCLGVFCTSLVVQVAYTKWYWGAVYPVGLRPSAWFSVAAASSEPLASRFSCRRRRAAGGGRGESTTSGSGAAAATNDDALTAAVRDHPATRRRPSQDDACRDSQTHAAVESESSAGGAALQRDQPECRGRENDPIATPDTTSPAACGHDEDVEATAAAAAAGVAPSASQLVSTAARRPPAATLSQAKAKGPSSRRGAKKRSDPPQLSPPVAPFGAAVLVGVMWVAGFACSLEGVDTLGMGVGYVITAVGPVAVSGLIATLYFDELRGCVNQAVFWASILIQGVVQVILISEDVWGHPGGDSGAGPALAAPSGGAGSSSVGFGTGVAPVAFRDASHLVAG